MLNNLLAWFKFNPGEGAFYAVFGFVFVFVGIAVLIGILYLVGFVMTKVTSRKTKKAEPENVQTAPVPQAVPEIEEGIPPQVIAAITAALAVYTEAEQQRCEFVVRRIRRI